MFKYAVRTVRRGDHDMAEIVDDEGNVLRLIAGAAAFGVGDRLVDMTQVAILCCQAANAGYDAGYEAGKADACLDVDEEEIPAEAPDTNTEQEGQP